MTHTLITGDGTICLVIDGQHFTVNVEHPSYMHIRKMVMQNTDFDDTLGQELLNLLDVPQSINFISEGKVRVDLEAGKVWYNDTEFHDTAFCERILRLMTEGQDVQYLLNFLNNLGQNPEFRAIMETFKFICNEGMPITPDGCFLGYKGVREDYYDEWSGTIENRPDGRRVDEPRNKVCNDPSKGCASGLHVGSYKYARNWGHTVVLVKVNPKDVVSVPNHECEKMRVCGYWVIKEFGPGSKDSREDAQQVLQGEVYDSTGQRVLGKTFADLDEQGQFDNEVNSHWDEEEGRTYSDSLSEADDYDDYDDFDDYDDWEDDDDDF